MRLRFSFCILYYRERTIFLFRKSLRCRKRVILVAILQPGNPAKMLNMDSQTNVAETDLLKAPFCDYIELFTPHNAFAPQKILESTVFFKVF